jgi:cellulose synthase/poly-beta-1,6-N-acetylglucosamine synthase-like glycosyltransferase
MMVLFLLVLALYLLVVAWLLQGSLKLTPYISDQTPSEIVRFTVIVPFRNEIRRIGPLLDSVASLNYPLSAFEFIFVDDESEDGSAARIAAHFKALERPLAYSIVPNQRRSGSPKKDAISLGVRRATGDWIITTDADCRFGPDWLNAFNRHLSHNELRLLAGPVAMENEPGMLRQFQLLDNLSLQLTTQGGFGWSRPFMCNGANLAFERSAFDQVGGYDGNNDLASGDDVFLLEKIQAAFPGSTDYLKDRDALIITQPVGSWKAVIAQRLRWASKTGRQQNWIPKLIGSTVVLTNLAMLALVPSLLWGILHLELLVGWVFLKLIGDTVVLLSSARTQGVSIKLNYLVAGWFCYPLVVLAVVIASLNSRYDWKGRSHRMSN